MNKKVYIVGAGPGDPELLTVKGKKIIDQADVIVYAGSLVNDKIFAECKSDCLIISSANKTLDEVLSIMEKGIKEDKVVVRVHTGDPSIYGAIREQIDALEQKKIDCEVIPGVSSFLASAAAIKKEFTLPGVSQTVICTRISGRTLVPDKENLASLASHRASMAIFLSVQQIENVVEELCKHYKKTTKVAVIQRASWPDQKIVLGTLANIANKVKSNKITKTAQILVGDFLDNEYELSKLYDKQFSHEYRKGTK